MATEVRAELSHEQYERLKKIKDKRGYTWKGLILEGANCIEEVTFTDKELAAMDAVVSTSTFGVDKLPPGELRSLLESAEEKIEEERNND